MKKPVVKDIKKAQRESLLLRNISQLFLQIIGDDPHLNGLFVSRIELSPEQGMCTVFFYAIEGKDFFQQALETLKLFKPSLRAAIAKLIPSRRTPELIFKFDEQFEKQQRMEQLFNKLKEEGKL